MSVLSKLADSLADSGDDIAMLSKASSNLDDVAARKAAQFELLQKTNPMLDNYHTGIRSAQEINRLQDLVDKFDADNMFTNPDFTIDNARAAVAKGTLPVFSSKPIEPGVFVSPSKMMATDYAGGDASKVFSKEIPLDDFAAILSGDEGNYLPIARAKSGSALGAMMSDGDAGNVFYHGTPSGGFTEFRDGAYFTPNKAYADSYQNPLASDISFGKEATNPMTYEVRLHNKKPFDISSPEARRIYIEDYIKGGNATGINPYLSQAEYDAINDIDWTEIEGLRDFLQDGGYDYDSIVANEGGFFDEAGKVVPRGRSTMVFNGKDVEILPQTLEALSKIIKK